MDLGAVVEHLSHVLSRSPHAFIHSLCPPLPAGVYDDSPLLLVLHRIPTFAITYIAIIGRFC